MAAACLFHLPRNHPFADGNERTALMCALVFLGLNGERLRLE
jgi:death-on-curing protein